MRSISCCRTLFAIVLIAARQGESKRLNTRKENAARALGNMSITACHNPGSFSPASAIPAITPIVLTMPSLATKPDREAATACREPNPSGVKTGEMNPPITASRLCSCSTRPNFPSANPKLAKATSPCSKRTGSFPLSFKKLHTLSHMHKNCLHIRNMILGQLNHEQGEGSPANIFVFFNIIQAAITANTPMKYISGAIPRILP